LRVKSNDAESGGAGADGAKLSLEKPVELHARPSLQPLNGESGAEPDFKELIGQDPNSEHPEPKTADKLFDIANGFNLSTPRQRLPHF
jgi:hypothetical protein